MNEYAVYVWSAYGVAALVLIGMGLATWRRLRTTEATLRSLDAGRARRRHAAAAEAGDDA